MTYHMPYHNIRMNTDAFEVSDANLFLIKLSIEKEYFIKVILNLTKTFLYRSLDFQVSIFNKIKIEIMETTEYISL